MHAAALGWQALKPYCMRACDVKMSITLTVQLTYSSESYRQPVELRGCHIKSVCCKTRGQLGFIYDPFLLTLTVMLMSYLLHFSPHS